MESNEKFSAFVWRRFILYEVIYMKAEFEPWWMFDGWETGILLRESFDNKIDADSRLNEHLMKFRLKFKHEQQKKQCFYAFWSEEEKTFCEACDDDLQIFHGLFILFNGEPIA